MSVRQILHHSTMAAIRADVDWQYLAGEWRDAFGTWAEYVASVREWERSDGMTAEYLVERVLDDARRWSEVQQAAAVGVWMAHAELHDGGVA